MTGRVALAVLVLLLGSCALRPIPYPAPASDMPDRPGLLSGPTGNAVLFSR